MDILTGAMSQSFMPHGYCLRWFPGLLWTHVISDAAIMIAYFSIPISIVYCLKKTKESRLILQQFGWLGAMFAAFILFCGMTHGVEIITIWEPYYGIEGVLKAITAVVSVITAIALVRLMPVLLTVKTSAQMEEEIHRRQVREQELERINLQLKREFESRHRAQASERDMRQAYNDLEETMAQLQASMAMGKHEPTAADPSADDLRASIVTLRAALNQLSAVEKADGSCVAPEEGLGLALQKMEAAIVSLETKVDPASP